MTTSLDAAALEPQPGGVLLDNCRLLDGVAPFVERAAVLVREGKVAYAGARGEVPRALADAARRVDLGGLTVLPGLIDCHAHLVYNGFRSLEEVDRCRSRWPRSTPRSTRAR